MFSSLSRNKNESTLDSVVSGYHTRGSRITQYSEGEVRVEVFDGGDCGGKAVVV